MPIRIQNSDWHQNDADPHVDQVFFTFSHICFIFLISVKSEIVFCIFFWHHIDIFWKKDLFINIFTCLELIPIRIGMPWMPIPIRKMIRHNDADPTRSGLHNTETEFKYYFRRLWFYLFEKRSVFCENCKEWGLRYRFAMATFLNFAKISGMIFFFLHMNQTIKRGKPMSVSC